MTLGALLDAGADESRFRKELAKLNGVEFELGISKVVRSGIQATDVQVMIQESHHHRRLGDIVEIIQSSALSDTVKERSIAIFTTLANAEGSVHGTSAEEVHFHEVGAVDAIVDIVGTCVGIELLGIDRIVCSPLPMGRGFVKAAHGLIPLPAPATVEILKGMPVYSIETEGEFVTPTGAAIVRTLTAILSPCQGGVRGASGTGQGCVTSFGPMPPMTVQSIGYGAGNTEFPFPNLLRIFVGESVREGHGALPPAHKVAVIETNIDDMNPEFFEPVMEKLFAAGAMDVYFSPIQMKKNRPATLLSAICPEDKISEIAGIILADTSSFGVRVAREERFCLERKWETVTTQYGDIRMKVGSLNGRAIKASPEYEDCKAAAKTHGVPIRDVYEVAVRAFGR
jgi:hypothetical protein